MYLHGMKGTTFHGLQSGGSQNQETMTLRNLTTLICIEGPT